MSHDVFISYSSKDKTIADAVCAKLEEKHIRAWIAPRDVLAGANFADSIISAINQCKILILIWSQNSNISDHVLNELNQALNHGILIIPFRIQEVQPTNAMQYYIGRTHWLDAYTPPLKKHINKLIETIQLNLENRTQLNLTGEVQKMEGEKTGIEVNEEHEVTISDIKNDYELESKEQENNNHVSGGKKRNNLANVAGKSKIRKNDHGKEVNGFITQNKKTIREFCQRNLSKVKNFAYTHRKNILIMSLTVLIVSALIIALSSLNIISPEFINSLTQPRPKSTEMAISTPGLVITKTSTQKPPTPTPTATQTVTPNTLGFGSTQISQVDGMPMVFVPAGEFSMGSDDNGETEKPVHTVYLDDYWIDQTEITNAQYAKCVNAGGCTAPSKTSSYSRDSYYGNSQYDDYPVLWVDWNQARDYCQWAGRELPTEAQWEKAARGTDGRTFPWGNDGPNATLANYNDSQGDTTAVGSYPDGASQYGALDMAGNVWEWVADWFGVYLSDVERNPTGPTSGEQRVLRGGSWFHYLSDGIRSAYRHVNYPLYSGYFDTGFRCAVTQD